MGAMTQQASQLRRGLQEGEECAAMPVAEANLRVVQLDMGL